MGPFLHAPPWSFIHKLSTRVKVGTGPKPFICGHVLVYKNATPKGYQS